MPKVAKVALVSSLPQLDRLFDYAIPSDLESSVRVGSRVRVPFGKSTKPFDGFVIDMGDDSAFEGSLATILTVVGVNPALPEELVELVQKLSLRSATGMGEILRLAVPANMPRSVLAHIAQTNMPLAEVPMCSSTSIDAKRIEQLTAPDSRHAVLTKPGEVDLQVGGQVLQFPSWIVEFCLIAVKNLHEGRSTLILVPDYRDNELLLSALEFLQLLDSTANYSQEQVKSKQFRAYLQALDDKPRVVIGSRAAMFAPAHNLSTIAIFDESDSSFTDQSSPYLNARDVLLLRQSIQGCSIVFSSFSRSTDIQRLVESGYLSESDQTFTRPKISVTEQGPRVDSNAFRAIKQGLATGSVLVQVASKGDSSALFCKSCDKRLLCATCGGPIWIDKNSLSKCRWCNGLSHNIRCSCGHSFFSTGRAGASRTSAELGRAFPGVKVVESTGENRITNLPPSKSLVISTPGSEPNVPGGYSAVVILDAAVLLSRQSLRATEDAIRLWANAVSKLSPAGEAVVVGTSGGLGQQFALWQIAAIASKELSTRRELSLPPAIRLGSISGQFEGLSELAVSLKSIPEIEILGPAPYSKADQNAEWRLLFKYPYSAVVEVAKKLSSEVSRISAGKSSVSRTGRNTRLLKVRMNDAGVI
jgi:primosomal protein N' (replication factor Y) (superfamily II helicase)